MRRPLNDRQRALTLESQMRGEDRPNFCPICGSLTYFWEQTHEFGSTTVKEDLGWECPLCGYLSYCSTCKRYASQRVTENLTEEDRKYLCKCEARDARLEGEPLQEDFSPLVLGRVGPGSPTDH